MRGMAHYLLSGFAVWKLLSCAAYCIRPESRAKKPPALLPRTAAELPPRCEALLVIRRAARRGRDARARWAT